MTGENKRSAAQRARVRITDQARRSGAKAPREFQASPVLVTWRAKPCNCRVLRIYLSPDGWHLIGERFRVTAEEWFTRAAGAVDSGSLPDGVPFTVESKRAGLLASPNLRRVAGVDSTLPLDFTHWPQDTFEVGCRHGHDYRRLTDARDDCA